MGWGGISGLDSCLRWVESLYVEIQLPIGLFQAGDVHDSRTR